MKHADQIPYYAPHGTSLGFRSLAAAKRLIAGGFVKASYGRKGHLKPIWLGREDGSNPVETRVPTGTRYSFLETWIMDGAGSFRHLDRKDEDGVDFSTRGIFVQVLAIAWLHETPTTQNRRPIRGLGGVPISGSETAIGSFT